MEKLTNVLWTLIVKGNANCKLGKKRERKSIVFYAGFIIFLMKIISVVAGIGVDSHIYTEV